VILTDFLVERRLFVAKSGSFKQVGRFTFLLWALLVATLWGSLSYLRPRSGDGFASYIAVAGVCLLAMIWMQCVEGRLQDAGLSRWYAWPYAVTLPFGCILLHAFKVVDGPQALLLFVLLQIPTVFIPSKPAIVKPSPKGVTQEGTIEESSRGLAALGGTMPELEDIPRRRVE
jgi:hypothetical protein